MNAHALSHVPVLYSKELIILFEYRILLILGATKSKSADSQIRQMQLSNLQPGFPGLYNRVKLRGGDAPEYR